MHRFWTGFLILLLLAAPIRTAAAQVQTDTPPDIDTLMIRWDASAARAEEALRNRRASTDALEALRTEIAGQRTEAFEIIERGDILTLTLQAQLDALGPPPADGAEETPAIAARRAELTEAFDAANKPILAAKQAFNRAEVLIDEIDKLIRARQRTDLFERIPSPLVPTRWLPAFAELGDYLSGVASEVSGAVRDPTRGLLSRQRIPIALALFGGSLVMLLAIQPFILRRMDAGVNAAIRPIRRNLLLGLSLALRFILPLIAGLLFFGAFASLGLTLYEGRSLNTIALTLPMLLVFSYWLGHALFAPTLPGFRFVEMSDRAARTATRICLGLGGMLALEIMLEQMEKDYSFAPETRSVLATTVVLLGSLLLWRLASLLARSDKPPEESTARTDADHEDATAFHPRALIAYLIRLAAIAAVVFSLAGYVEIARDALGPMIRSLGLLGVALAVYRLLVSASHIAVREEKAVSSLMPFAAATIVALATLPLFALIWGAREADISDVWILLTEGVEFGGTRISFGVVVMLVAIFVIGVILTRWLQRMLSTTVLPKTRLDSGGRNAVVTGLGYVGITLSALIAVSTAGLDLSSITIVAGALSVGIGFGLQAIVSNFISGIILLIERPIKEGDWIEVAGNSGIVRKISVRSTRIETFDRHEVIVPNADLIAGTVTNMTLSSHTGRLIVPVGVAYGSDLEKTREILLEKARAHRLVLKYPEPVVLFMGLGESALDFELRCFVNDVYSVLSARSDLLFEIYRALSEAGIEIPFPQRDVSLRNVGDIVEAVTARRDGGQAPKPAPDPA